jgi:hypothetical protein
VNKTLYEPFLGKKSILIMLVTVFLFLLTGCTDKSSDNVTAVDNKPYQSNTDGQSGTSDDTNNSANSNTSGSVPSCH